MIDTQNPLPSAELEPLGANPGGAIVSNGEIIMPDTESFGHVEKPTIKPPGGAIHPTPEQYTAIHNARALSKAWRDNEDEPEVSGFQQQAIEATGGISEATEEAYNFGEFGLLDELTQTKPLSLRERLNGRLQYLASRFSPKSSDEAPEGADKRRTRGGVRRAIGATALALAGGVMGLGIVVVHAQPAAELYTSEPAEIISTSSQLDTQEQTSTMLETREVKKEKQPASAFIKSPQGQDYFRGLKAVENATGIQPGQPGFDEAFSKAVQHSEALNTQKRSK